MVLSTTLWFLYKATSVKRQQRTNINKAYSIYSEILYDVPQGSILRPLLFNTYLSDMLYDNNNCDIVSHADDNIQFTSDFNREEAIQKLVLNTNNLIEWF